MLNQQVEKTFLIVLAFIALGGVAASAQTYDVAWTFGNVNSSSYRLDAFEPDDIDFGVLGSQDPTLPLELGKRYQVKVTGYGFHPFEIIAKANSPGQDVVLLSMTVQGPFESDPEVSWEDDGRGTVRFTLTAPLFQAMTEGGRTPGYRCRAHVFDMRGDFTVAGLPIAERIAPSSIPVDLEVVASGLTAPVALVPDPAGMDRLYVVDQSGPVWIIEQGQLLEEPFLDVGDLLVQPLGFLGSFDVNDFDERGFLGLTFHPDFADPTRPGFQRFYTYTSEPVAGPADFTLDLPPDEEFNHQSVIREWQLAPAGELVHVESSRVVLRIDEPQFNHNAGHIAFGPDGYMYIALGDGGGANDTSAGHGETGNGQNIQTVHGSILRIDPLEPALTPASLDPASANGAYRVPLDNPFVGVDGADEIYAYGFRNPYRFSFDALSGALIVADVGQRLVEEINIVNKGRNYGWNLKEGSFKFDPEGIEVGLPLDDPALTNPVAEYDHDDGISIIGGYTYYGSEVPDLWGRYVFGDFSRAFRTPDGRLFVADLFTGQIEELLIGAGNPLGLFVKGIGQDADGEVYVLASTALGPYGDTGVVLKIISASPRFVTELSGTEAGTDSNTTGRAVIDLVPGGDEISYLVTVENIVNATMAHIHVASEPGGDGAPAVWLYPSAPPAVLIPGEFTGVLAEGRVSQADLVGPLAGGTLADLVQAIRENRAYVNVHTEKHPAGAIRGRLARTRVQQTPISAELSGGPASTDSEAIGRTILKLDPEQGSVSFELEVLGIENVTQAHIHVADSPGGNGPPAVWLYPSAPPASLIDGAFRGVLAEGMFSPKNFVGPLANKDLTDLLSAIKDNRAYVNVHTQQNPAGEIRGQLR